MEKSPVCMEFSSNKVFNKSLSRCKSKSEPQEELQPQEKVQNQVKVQNPPNIPIVTLVQSLGIRQYRMCVRTVDGHQLCVITFQGHRGLTLLLAPSYPHRPTDLTGLVQLDVHRKYLTTYGKYLHWVTFTFQSTGHRVQAQIMLNTRLNAAYNMVEGGAAACFINSPFPLLRRAQASKRQRCQSRR